MGEEGSPSRTPSPEEGQECGGGGTERPRRGRGRRRGSWEGRRLEGIEGPRGDGVESFPVQRAGNMRWEQNAVKTRCHLDHG